LFLITKSLKIYYQKKSNGIYYFEQLSWPAPEFEVFNYKELPLDWNSHQNLEYIESIIKNLEMPKRFGEAILKEYIKNLGVSSTLKNSLAQKIGSIISDSNMDLEIQLQLLDVIINFQIQYIMDPSIQTFILSK